MTLRITGIIIACLIAALILCGCGKNARPETEPETSEIKTDKKAAFINGVTEADVWILPETEENRKTTVWGTPTAAKVKNGESRDFPLCEPGDGGKYLFRMIDTGHFYYSAGGILLEDGWSLEIKGEDMNEMTLEVKDKNGEIKDTYDVFCGRL